MSEGGENIPARGVVGERGRGIYTCQRLGE